MKPAALDLTARIHFHNIVLDNQSVDIQGAGSRGVDHFSPDIKCRSMAGTGKSLLFINPGDRAPEMGTLTGNSQKTTVFQSAKVKFTPNKGRNGIDRESLYGAGFNNRPGLAGYRPRFECAKIHQDYAGQFNQCENPQANPELV